jgi:hypothetical protein
MRARYRWWLLGAAAVVITASIAGCILWASSQSPPPAVLNRSEQIYVGMNYIEVVRLLDDLARKQVRDNMQFPDDGECGFVPALDRLMTTSRAGDPNGAFQARLVLEGWMLKIGFDSRCETVVSKSLSRVPWHQLAWESAKKRVSRVCQVLQ